MSTFALTRRAALAAFGASALAMAVAGPIAHARSESAFPNIRVDVSPLRANVGDPTAAWVAEELPAQLAQVLAGRMAQHGPALVVRIDYLTFGSPGGALGNAEGSYDNIAGVATINGVQVPVRATTTYHPEFVRPRVGRTIQSLPRVSAHASACVLDFARRNVLIRPVASSRGYLRRNVTKPIGLRGAIGSDRREPIHVFRLKWPGTPRAAGFSRPLGPWNLAHPLLRSPADTPLIVS